MRHALQLSQGVSAPMVRYDVVAGGYLSASRHGPRVQSQSRDIIVDVLRHIYRQDELLRDLKARAFDT